MKSTNKNYIDLVGKEIDLTGLAADEISLVGELKRKARQLNDWNAFDNFKGKRIVSFYEAKGYSRKRLLDTAVWRIAQDLSGRIAVAAGLARLPDYRDELEDIILTRFKSQAKFCEATGLSPDMVSHVLARRKHIAIDTLNDALAKIGYTIRILEKSA